MNLVLYNSLTKNKEKFIPINEEKITMYVCGPTVYNLIHIGNARAQIVYDILYRILINIYKKDKVLYAQNITDIDDKIIERASSLSVSASELTKNTIENFLEDVKYLGCLEPNVRPQATHYIQNIISMIQTLIEKEVAYENKGCVYLDITKTNNYTQLLNLNPLEVKEDISGHKKHIQDFTLWKSGKTNEKVEDLFDSPWSKGRPGWHIECSAMIHKIFGDTIDIHAGGIDLKFPHHTNEIAQSTLYCDTKILAKFWIHNELLTINKSKMSKSLGNTVTVQDLKKKGISTALFRLFLLNTHYRKKIDFSEKIMIEMKKKLSYITNAIKTVSCNKINNFYHENMANKIPEQFKNYILDDLNTHSGIEYIMQEAKNLYKKVNIEESLQNLVQSANFLGILENETKSASSNKITSQEIEQLIAQRAQAKKMKNYEKADDIRDILEKHKIFIKDSANNKTIWWTK